MNTTENPLALQLLGLACLAGLKRCNSHNAALFLVLVLYPFQGKEGEPGTPI